MINSIIVNQNSFEGKQKIIGFTTLKQLFEIVYERVGILYISCIVLFRIYGSQFVNFFDIDFYSFVVRVFVS